MKYILFFVLMVFCVQPENLKAQVESHSNIILTSPDDSLRNVHGLAFPITDSSGLQTMAFTGGYFYFGQADSSNIHLQFNPEFTTLNTGMYFNLKFTATNGPNLTLKIDQLPVKLILNYDSQPLDSGMISPDEMITVVYDGTNFIIINPPKEKCPAGFTKINDRFCIETNERAAADIFTAVTVCSNNGSELCGYSDWFEACLHGTGLNNMVDNYEWVNSAGNSGNQFKVVGMNSAAVTGCNKNYTVYEGNLNAYRCCYFLKR